MTLLEAINKAARVLSEQGIDNARLDAEVLLAHCLNRDRAWLITHMRDVLDEERRREFEETVRRRARREPLQYILGRQEFWGLEFAVTPDVLIPRPETELIVEAALAVMRKRDRPLTIVDLCTGSGCIAVSLARELTGARIIATDTSAPALLIAQKNAERHRVADRVRFLEGDLFSPLESLDIGAQIDIIVANPPYIPSQVLSELQPEVRDYEPEAALIAGPDGTSFHQRIISGAPPFLKEQGALIVEMGIGQADRLTGMVREQGQYESVEILKDLAGIERVLCAVRKR